MLRGKCLCEQVQFEIPGSLPGLYQCHCSQCRRQSGASSNTATIVSADNFRWISGQTCISEWRHDAGFHSHFCSTCGCPVPNPLGDLSHYWIPVGLLDTPGHTEVHAHLFVGSKGAWDKIPDGGTCYDTMPEISEFIAFLNRHKKD